MVFACRICGNQKDNVVVTAKEMMFGFRESFDYVECSVCGCLQIKDVPPSLSQYYPENYYSFQAPAYRHKPLKIFLKKQLIDFHVYKKMNFLGKILSRFYPNFEDFYEWFQEMKTSYTARILDVGCGAGNLLLKLRKSGYTNVMGVDPFITKDIHYDGGLSIYKKSLSEIVGQYDVIIMNHSFEHMPGQLEIFQQVYRLLKSGGWGLIRIPVTGTYAWRTYGVNWVQLDAPRHLYLHTEKSMRVLAEKSGLQLKKVVFDSNSLQFWGSEQYVQDIPLRDQRSFAEGIEHSIFTPEQITEFEKRSLELNQKNDGDAATFYLYKN